MAASRADDDSVDMVRRAIYAAVTRARSHLTMAGDPDSARALGFDRLARALDQS